MSPFHPHSRRRRALLATGFIALVLCTLGAAFFRTQVIKGTDFVLRSENNRLRAVPLPAPRGTIYDRNGLVIAETVVSYTLSLEPGEPREIRARLERLAPVLALDSARIAEVLAQLEERPRDPVLVSQDLDFAQVSWIEEHRPEIGGILLEERPLRRYPYGEAVAHLIGYVAEISDRELSDSAWADYEMGQMIGKAGLEREYERQLAGRMGERYIEVDARGRTIRPLPQSSSIPPIPGADLQLTLDLELQRFAHRIFPEDMRGAIVAMVPSTGEILTLYSHPTYDPNLLVGGASPDVWRMLSENPGRPLLNRATYGIYPPGSTWKLATAMIGLEKGVITPQTRMPIPCTGGMSYAGRYSRCWKAEGHGILDLAGAIAHSCNVYFYQLGIRLGLNQLLEAGSRLGFGEKTGIDLPGEEEGIFPDGIDWYERRYGHAPPPSVVMSLAIGQGANAQTPLRMAQFFSAIAGNGTAPVPHLATSDEPVPVEIDLNVSHETLEAARVGLARVLEPGGTAYMASLARWKVYGKTGTAQNSQDPERPHAWFTGFAGPPTGDPEIVIAVIVEFGESGSGTAAPLAAKLADFYLNRKHGFPTDTIQTLAERIRAGRAAFEQPARSSDTAPAAPVLPQVIGLDSEPRPALAGEPAHSPRSRGSRLSSGMYQ